MLALTPPSITATERAGGVVQDRFLDRNLLDERLLRVRRGFPERRGEARRGGSVVDRPHIEDAAHHANGPKVLREAAGVDA